MTKHKNKAAAEAAAILGRLGGAAGKGDSKRRSIDQYREMARLSWVKRRKSQGNQ